MEQEQPRERRAFHRIPCTADGDLVIRIWRIPPDDPIPRDPKPGTSAQTIPVDLSAGGAGVLIAPEDFRRLVLNRSILVGMQIQRKEANVLLHGLIRRVFDRADGYKRLGIDFQLAEMSLERKRSIIKLESLIAAIRRTELEHLAMFGVADSKQV